MKKAAIIAIFFLSVAAIILSPLDIREEQRWIFYDNSGEILFSEIPHFQAPTRNERLEKILIAIEDNNFNSHLGVDPIALTRAAYYNFRYKRITSGASTITMQLARLLFLENEFRDNWYKLRQIFYAVKLDAQFSKQEILEMYLSHAYFGNNATGIDAAANLYFNKPTAALSTPQIATLVGILPRPDAWNPIKDSFLASQRRDHVLQILLKKEIITPRDLEIYLAAEMPAAKLPANEIHSPHFVIWAKKQLEKTLSNASGEIHVHSTILADKYQKTLALIRDKISNAKVQNISNMSVVALDLPSNKLEIMLGSQDFFDDNLDGEVNMTTAPRQTGSTLKPFLYALALEKGMSPLSEISDNRQSFRTGSGSYSPRNFEPTREHGTVRFREALANSYNIAAVDLLNKLGTADFHDTLSSLQIQAEQDQDDDLSVILGTGESSLLQLTRAYSVFPHRGQLHDVQFFSDIKNKSGDTLLSWEQFNSPAREIFATSTAEWITHALSDDPARWWSFQQGNPLELPFPAAAKTGTSQDFRDNYVLGFSSEKVVGVWAGNTDGTPMHTSSGIEGAGASWHTVMQIIHDNPPAEFTYKSQRQESQICRRPYDSWPDCAEKHTEFLLPHELTQETVSPLSQKKFSISYPDDGDIFHPDSSISINVRNIPHNESVRYFIDAQETNHVISHHLSPGPHELSVSAGDSRDTITIHIAPK